MKIIGIEDQKLLRNALEQAISAAEPTAEVTLFRNAEEALGSPEAQEAQVAFVDVRLAGMDGIRAAKFLRERNPRLNVVIATNYAEYMADALDMHVSGYITKPVTAEKVRRELDELRFPVVDGGREPDAGPVLHVRCFGNFEAYAAGAPLSCKSARAVELLAYLVDRRGARCSVGEIEAALWGDRRRTSSRQSHLRNLLAELSRSLGEAGCGNVLVKQYGYVGLDTSLVACDYWDYLDGKPGSERAFRGEYMTQYSWAERTLGNLLDFS